jgi:hypothetical protein
MPDRSEAVDDKVEIGHDLPLRPARAHHARTFDGGQDLAGVADVEVQPMPLGPSDVTFCSSVQRSTTLQLGSTMSLTP